MGFTRKCYIFTSLLMLLLILAPGMAFASLIVQDNLTGASTFTPASFDMVFSIPNTFSFWLGDAADNDVVVTEKGLSTTGASEEIACLMLSTVAEKNYTFTINWTDLSNDSLSSVIPYSLELIYGNVSYKSTGTDEYDGEAGFTYTYTKTTSGNSVANIGQFFASVKALDASKAVSGLYTGTVTVSYAEEG